MSGYALALVLVVLLLADDPAQAQALGDLAGVVLEGLRRPWLTPAHAITLLALGLLLGGQGQAAWRLLAAFSAALAAGLTAIALAVGETAASEVLLADAALAGLLLALAATPPKLVAGAIAATAGVALGLDSPPTVTSVAAGNTLLIGTGLGACVGLVAVIAGATFLRRDWQRIGVRIVGSWIAASAILVLALRVTARVHQ